jgi:hypothetical protein
MSNTIGPHENYGLTMTILHLNIWFSKHGEPCGHACQDSIVQESCKLEAMDNGMFSTWLDLGVLGCTSGKLTHAC